MKREIKFRAWHPKKKTMGNVIDMWMKDGRVRHIAISNNDAECETWFPEDGFMVMQFTGLKDKNSKEIYEGDIVRLWDLDSYDKENDKLILEPTDNISFVEYSGHGFWLKDEYFGWEGEGLWSWDKLEVIGNIHENPELLNNEQSVQVSDTTGDDSKENARTQK